MRIVIAECSVDYSGRLTAHLDRAPRVLMAKADGSLLVHSDGGSYKPLNWMSAPCRLTVSEPSPEQSELGAKEIWEVRAQKSDDRLLITIFEVFSEISYQLGEDPGLEKDGVEAHLQALLAAQPEVLGKGLTLVRREYPTPIGPVDLMLRNSEGDAVIAEVKRVGGIEGVEQLTRYLEMLGRDPLLKNLTGLYVAQTIKPQARVLAEDRGIQCIVVDYDALRGFDDVQSRLF
ncbi:endonuclease NucS [Boudabousia marimammalium]|uniref:Endonuclease NucS n=1 Tax=Boudabousia marimammalium TaxID=156892 RepID=A0A1Q5PRC3_9ACTO|nr:endonuclease NucS [Boudabousia marimammalium]OKL50158.1 endonuclease [Boudabousia marimammalium]